MMSNILLISGVFLIYSLLLNSSNSPDSVVPINMVERRAVTSRLWLCVRDPMLTKQILLKPSFSYQPKPNQCSASSQTSSFTIFFKQVQVNNFCTLYDNIVPYDVIQYNSLSTWFIPQRKTFLNVLYAVRMIFTKYS